MDYTQARKTVMAHITPEFVEALQVLFPPNRPLPGTSIDTIMHDSGQQSMIEFFKSKLDEASDNLLE